MSSGYKRSRDHESDYNSNKRSKDEPRDWKDIHLTSDRDKDKDRHKSRRDSESHRASLRDRDYRHSSYRRDSDYRRDRDLDDDKDGHRSGERRHGFSSRHSSRHRHRSHSRSRSRPRKNDGHSHRRGSKDRRSKERHSHKEDSEKEEGEISPQSLSFSRGPTRSISVSTRAQTPPPSKPKEPEPEMELEIPKSPPPVEETLAARRARRQAILAKHAGVVSVSAETSGSSSNAPDLSSAVQQPPSLPTISDPVSQSQSAVGTPGVGTATMNVSLNGQISPTGEPSMDAFSLAKEEDEQANGQLEAGGEQISAADYDPSLDRREDEQKRFHLNGDNHGGDVEMIEVEEEEEDDVDDMFAIITSEKKKKKKVRKVAQPAAPALITTTLDSAADPEGYYTIILGEQLDGGRYQVFSSLGKGMFANVVRARILQGEVGEVGREVAIKIVRCQESMYKAGLKEVQILNKLKQADPDDKKHVVRIERTFEHRGHLCLVFESLSMNLRDVVKRFGKDVGLNIRAVRAYAHQLFLAMLLLRKCNIMHADIKPDNILVSEQKTVVKLCDLGSASDASENDITPYLVSRFYRAPEIILGVPYDCSLDMWSIGCTLYELYTGKILLPGRSNNHMLLLMMELKGRFNSKMIKRAKFGDLYFDDMGAFTSVERDRLNGADIVRKVHVAKPTRDLRARLLPSSSKVSDDEQKLILSFIDLLDKCLMLDPARRITPREALVHPFITSRG